MHNSLNKAFLTVLALIIPLLSACGAQERTSDERFAELITARAMEGGVSRADPGYMQYLERQSMHAGAARLAQMVSGSNFIWRRPAASPKPETLLEQGGVWLAINPQTIQTPGRLTPLSHLSSPMLWTSLGKYGITGLYLAPTGASGNLWDYDPKRSLGVNDDIIHFNFAKSIGTEEDYARIIEQANAHKILLGGDLVPAATGIGPDFLLAVRNLRDYPGIYCLIEVPKHLWTLLPAPERTDSEMEVFALNEARTERLSREGLFPARLRQDAWAPYIESGWGATGEVRGGDGNLRRWVYRYAGSLKRPILNFNDPSGGAREIMSGSIIFQSAILGNALNAARLYPLIGLEPESEPPAGPGDPANFSLLNGVAVDIARQSRAYGSRSWLRDDLPLPAARALMDNGPDLFQDNVFSPAAEHALLCGDASLLNFMADEAISAGLDWRRLVHGSISHEGVGYALPHLRYLAGQSKAHPERARAARKLLAEVPEQARNAAEPAGREFAVSLFESGRLHTTPAGLAALALGLHNNLELTPSLELEIRRGHMLLQFFKAMQPGVYMLSGQDITGTMPVETRPPAAGARADERLAERRLASMGSFPLLISAESGVYSSLGLPRAKSLYGSLDLQLYQPSSFALELGQVIELRRRLGIAVGTMAGRLQPVGRGVSALVTRLPASGSPDSGKTLRRYAVSVVNFNREESSEYLDLSSIPELAEIAREAGAETLAGNFTSVLKRGNWLIITAPGWSSGLVLIEGAPANTSEEEMLTPAPEDGEAETPPDQGEPEILDEPVEIERLELPKTVERFEEPEIFDGPEE